MKYHIAIENGDIIASFEHEGDRNCCREWFAEFYDNGDSFTAVDDEDK